MENEIHHESNSANEKRENPTAATPGDSASAEKIEETAKALSQEDDTRQDKEPKPEKQSEQTDDPGLVARMTAKGALSGF